MHSSPRYVLRVVRTSVVLSLFFAGILAVGVSGCKGLTESPGLPAGTPNPTIYNTKSGALGMRSAAIFEVQTALPQYVLDAGLLTDELEDANTMVGQSAPGDNPGAGTDPLDKRILTPNVTVMSYGYLQSIREYANLAIGALATYDTAAADMGSSKALRGELLALEGYAELMLADLFCSGVPLSTLDFGKDFTYAPSSTTAQIYTDAIAKFETALTLAGDSTQVLNLARVGKGRALLDLGQVDVAAAAVQNVPDDFQYQLATQWVPVNGSFTNVTFLNNTATVSDREGINGLPFLSSGDPRTAVDTVVTTDQNGNPLPIPLTFPIKYAAALSSGNGAAPFTLASGVEARLIAAEAALHAGDVATWLTTLNRLRTNGDSSTVTNPAITVFDTSWVTGCTNNPSLCKDSIPTGTSYAGFTINSIFTVTVAQGSPAYNVCFADAGSRVSDCNNPLPVVVYSRAASSVTTYQAGTGGVSGLGQLTDPGTASARVSLLFQERAYWLFLDGHRQGDLRRLLRQYSQYPAFRSQQHVYPIGFYFGPGKGVYGANVVAPVPTTEYANPKFHGCISNEP